MQGLDGQPAEDTLILTEPLVGSMAYLRSWFHFIILQ